jgi:hypothetical protein
MGVEYALKMLKGERFPPVIPVETDLVTIDKLK